MARPTRWWWAWGVAALTSCSSTDECAPYLCDNRVIIVGSIAASEELEHVDSTFCDADGCRTQVVEVTTVAGACSNALDGVCLTRSGDRLELTATWSYPEISVPKDLSYRIQLSDPLSGQLLLDEARTVKATITREDGCHTCWAAEAEL